MLQVELVYVPSGHPVVHMSVPFQAGMTIADVLHESDLLVTHPEVKDYGVGVFGQLATLNTVLKPRDRIEIYRPLLIDPMVKRRERACLSMGNVKST